MLCQPSLFIFSLCRHVTFYKTLTSLSTVFIKGHVRFLQLLKCQCRTSFFTHVEPSIWTYYVETVHGCPMITNICNFPHSAACRFTNDYTHRIEEQSSLTITEQLKQRDPRNGSVSTPITARKLFASNLHVSLEPTLTSVTPVIASLSGDHPSQWTAALPATVRFRVFR